jgi:NADPH:quinone reductase-like Zn-dependent oxidoreductase
MGRKKENRRILRLIQRTYATPEMGEVLVANEAVALNPVDWKCLEWNHPAWSSGHTPGVDGAGRIVAVGEGVTLSIGTRVAYHQDIARDGSFATHTLLPAKAAMAVPDALNASVAASMPCPGLTAWQALKKLPFVENRDVLVIGGGGSAALYCIQLAIQRGFRVWTTAAPRHHTRLLELGVIGAFDYRSPTWREDLSRALGVRKLFAAIDTVNEAHAQSLSPIIGYNGHIICVQERLSWAIAPPFTTAISQHEVALNAIYSHGTEWDWTELRKYGTTMLNQLSAGDLETPHLVSFAFDELPQALHSLKGGSESGKLVSTLPRV